MIMHVFGLSAVHTIRLVACHEMLNKVGTLSLRCSMGDTPHTAALFRPLNLAVRCWLWRGGGPLAMSIVAMVEGRIGRALLDAVVEDRLGDGRRIDRLAVDHVDVEGEAQVVV